METTLNSDSRTARFAASLFVFVCVPLSLWGETYIPNKIFVAQDPVTTANNLLSNEFVFRLSMLTHLAGTLIFIFMMLLFYRIFKPVDKHLARLMLVPLLGQIPIVFVMEIFNFVALSILKGEPRPGFDLVQQQEVAYFLMRLERSGSSATKIFFGLSFIPFGIMAIRSGLVPRVIGVLLIIGGIAYVIDTSLYFLLERLTYLMIRSFLKYTYFTYMIALLWFVIMGLRRKGVGATPVLF